MNERFEEAVDADEWVKGLAGPESVEATGVLATIRLLRRQVPKLGKRWQVGMLGYYAGVLTDHWIDELGLIEPSREQVRALLKETLSRYCTPVVT